MRMIGLLRKKQHRLRPDYESNSSDEEEQSYYSQEDEQDDDDEEEQPFQGEQYDEDEEEEEVSQYSDCDDEESIDPELLCPTCNTQTHEYVRKGTILKKWKRMPVEDPDVVDEKTGECVACRLSKLKADLFDDLPFLPDPLLPATISKLGQSQGDRSLKLQSQGQPQKAESTPVVSNRKKNSSTSTAGNKDEENSLFDEVSVGVSSFSCGLSRASGRMETLQEVPEREDTSDSSEDDSYEEREEEEEANETQQEDEEEEEFSQEEGEEDQSEDEVIEESSKRTPTVASDQSARFNNFLSDHAASPFKPCASATDTATDGADGDVPTTAFEASAALPGCASVSGQNCAEATVSGVSNVLEHYIEEKDQLSTKKKMAEMGRTFRGIIFNKGRSKKSDEDHETKKMQLKDEENELQEQEQDSISAAQLEVAQKEIAQWDVSFPTASAAVGAVASPVAEPTKSVNNVSAVPPVPLQKDPQDLYDEAAIVVAATTEKDPQDFYDEAAKVVAAKAMAAAAVAPEPKPYEAKKTKMHTLSIFRTTKASKEKATAVPDTNIKANNIEPKPDQQTAVGGGVASLEFPDLLPQDKKGFPSNAENNTSEPQDIPWGNSVPQDMERQGPMSSNDRKKSGKSAKKIGNVKLGLPKIRKKKPVPTNEEGDEKAVLLPANPFLPPNVVPVANNDKTSSLEQTRRSQVASNPIFSMFPDNILSSVPEDAEDNSPPPPVLEIATGPEEEDESPNPNTTDVAHLIKGLQSTVDDPRLARKFLISLRTMSIHHPNRLGIAEAGGIHAIVVCMSRFKRESAVAKQGCAALQNLICADSNEHRCVDEGALDAIVRAMMNHIRSPGTQEHGAAALRNLTAGSLSNRSAVAEAGGIEALVKAMKVHSRNVAVQEKGCAALGNLCIKHADNRVAVGKAGGIRVVVQALSRHGYKSRDVAEKGIRCLLNLSSSSSNVEMMKWEAGIEGLVLGVAHRHGGRCKEWALKIFLKM